MNYFETDYVVIWWDMVNQAVVTEWQGSTGGELDKLKNGFEKGLELLTEHKGHKWLLDMRKSKSHSDKSGENWVVTIWQPQATAAGMRYLATVVPQEILAHLNVLKNVERLTQHQAEVKYFDSFEEARTWLAGK